ncbi:MAG: T9SS type A sorting domain-containing protein [Prolixibacteraceae bacterium]|jgi:hypothetical protein|nr:T9SS type A sorting domain-containing protein [Prolixibacteraceae bacterium]
MKNIYLFLVLISIAFSASAQNWLSYQAEVLPAETVGDNVTLDLTKTSSDSPGENFTQTIIADADIDGNNILEYLQPDGKTMYRSDFNNEFTGTAFTIVARIKGTGDETYDRVMDIQWRNGNHGTRDELRISPSDSTIELSKSEVSVKVDMDLNEWHTYRIVVVDDHAAVYIDEATELTVEAITTSSSSDTYFKFGDESGDAIGGYLDWIVLWLGDENPELPEGMTGMEQPYEPVWLSYLADVLPAETTGENNTLDLTKLSSDSPGENFSQTIIEDIDIAGNNLLEYLQPDGKTMFRSDFPANFAGTAFTFVARIQGINDPAYDRAMDIQWRNGNFGTRDELRISPVDSTIGLSKSDVYVKVDMDLYAWHTYRIVVVDDHAAVYIDEASEPVVEAITTSSTGDNYIKFGDESGDAIGGNLDWMVVWLGAENPTLPSGLTGMGYVPVWLNYLADVLPAETTGEGTSLDLTKLSSDSPGENFTQTIVADTLIEGNNLLEYLQPDGKTMYRSDFPDEFTGTAFTLVARVKGIEDEAYDRVMDIQWRNGNSGTRDELRISPADSTIELAKSGVEVKVDMDLYAWHTYRVVVVGDHAAVYIDEESVPVVEAVTTSSTGDNYIKFGDESGQAIGGYLDWMVVWLGEENPALPEYLTGLPLGTYWMNYLANVMPEETLGSTLDLTTYSSDSPGETFSAQIVADTEIAGNNLLEYMQPDGKRMYRSNFPDEWTETNFTVVARVKGIMDEAYDRAMDIQWRNGNSGTRDELRISPADSTIGLSKSEVSVKVEKDLYAWHTYRIVVTGDHAAVFMDEEVSPVVEATTTSSTGDNYIKFGDESGQAIGGYLDWIVVWLGHENPALPDYCTGAPEAQVHVKSGDSKLADLTTSAGELSPDFDPYTLEYTLMVGLENESITLAGVANHDSASIAGDGLITVIPSVVELVVTAEDGSTKTYSVSVDYYYPSTDATLASLMSTKGEISPEFSVDVYEYTLTVDEGTANLLLSATANDSKTTVIGDGLITAIPSTVDIVVTAEDGTTLTYTVSIEFKVGINDIASQMLDVYPNPVQNKLFINTGVESSKLSIYNLAGAKVISNTIGASYQLDVSELNNGVYFLNIENNTYSSKSKLIKK